MALRAATKKGGCWIRKRFVRSAFIVVLGKRDQTTHRASLYYSDKAKEEAIRVCCANLVNRNENLRNEQIWSPALSAPTSTFRLHHARSGSAKQLSVAPTRRRPDRVPRPRNPDPRYHRPRAHLSSMVHLLDSYGTRLGDRMDEEVYQRVQLSGASEWEESRMVPVVCQARSICSLRMG